MTMDSISTTDRLMIKASIMDSVDFAEYLDKYMKATSSRDASTDGAEISSSIPFTAVDTKWIRSLRTIISSGALVLQIPFSINPF